jgi:GNAT superfamily N-acetyltransferase
VSGEGPRRHLRVATLADVPALQELIPLSARTLQAPYYTPSQIEGALGTVFGVDTQLIADGTYFIVEESSALAGCGGWSKRRTLFGGDAMARREDSLLDPQMDAARVRAFFVHPAHARRGIGRLLMEACEAAATAAGFKKIEIVATLAGEPLYRQFGYEVTERFEIPLENGERLPAVRMRKR